jgi:hypothetical protein
MPQHDTAPSARQAQLAALRRAGAAGRVRLAAELCEDTRRIVSEAVRRRHPDFGEAEVRRALLRTLLGEALASRVCAAGWPR